MPLELLLPLGLELLPEPGELELLPEPGALPEVLEPPGEPEPVEVPLPPGPPEGVVLLVDVFGVPPPLDSYTPLESKV